MPETAPARKSPLVPLIIAAVAGLALLAALLGGTRDDEEGTSRATDGTAGTAGTAAEEGPLAGLARREADDPMAMGDVDAPVVMVEYSDFQCPYCGKFARDTKPELKKKYVKDGTLRIEWRDFPYLGEESQLAAHAGRAAAAQGKFWEYHDAMYADMLPPNSGQLDEAHLAGVAEELGLDVEQFRADLADAAAKQAVDADIAEGVELGVNGTPTFVINGTPVVGAQPIEEFEKAIEGALR